MIIIILSSCCPCFHPSCLHQFSSRDESGGLSKTSLPGIKGRNALSQFVRLAAGGVLSLCVCVGGVGGLAPVLYLCFEPH